MKGIRRDVAAVIDLAVMGIVGVGERGEAAQVGERLVDEEPGRCGVDGSIGPRKWVAFSQVEKKFLERWQLPGARIEPEPFALTATRCESAFATERVRLKRVAIILLDLNMPRMDGIEVMQEITRDEKLEHLVTVVLTSSKADEDVMRSYKLRCNSYLVKPINFEAFAKMIESLGDYWFTLVMLPPK